jgi:hypothetical protein
MFYDALSTTQFAGLNEKIRGVFFLTSDRASKEVRNAREPDLRVA